MSPLTSIFSMTGNDSGYVNRQNSAMSSADPGSWRLPHAQRIGGVIATHEQAGRRTHLAAKLVARESQDDEAAILRFSAARALTLYLVYSASRPVYCGVKPHLA